MNKNDLRVRRTGKSLENALFKLIKRKGLNEISIKELTEEAMISRQTFYAHYQSKEDLYLVCSSNFFTALNIKIRDKVEGLGLETQEEIFEVAIDYYQKNLDKIRILFSINDKDLIIKSIGHPARMNYELLGLQIDADNKELMIGLISGLTYTMIQSWLDKRNENEASQVIQAMLKILSLMNRKI